MLVVSFWCPYADLETLLAHKSVKELILGDSERKLSVEIGTKSLDGFGMLCLKVIQIHSCYDQWIVDGRDSGDIFY